MNEHLHLRTTGLIITERCTLRCRLCGEFSPYYKNPRSVPLEDIKRAIDTLFMHVDSVGDFSLSGGEPLLHRDISEILKHLNQYANRINRMLILTNGTIVPSEDFLRVAKSLPDISQKFKFHISDYGPQLSVKTEAVENVLQKFHVEYRIIRYWGTDVFCNGWVDYGDNSQKYFTSEEILAHASKCEFRKHAYFSLRIVNGKGWLARCGRAFWRMQLGITPSSTDDVVCLGDGNPSETAEIQQKIAKLIDASVSDSCAYCNGLCEDSERFPPAEQLSK